MAFERRRHARVKIESLVPVDLGRDNGGIVLDASEGGLRVRLVGPVAPTQVFPVVIVLTGKKERIEASGQIAWTDESRTRAGVQFIGLSNSSPEQIKEWLAINDPARSTEQEPPTTEPARAETTLAERVPSQEREEDASHQVAVWSAPDATFEDLPEELVGASEESVQFDAAAPKTVALPRRDEPYEPWKKYRPDRDNLSDPRHAKPDKADRDFERRRNFVHMVASVALIALVFCASAAVFLSWPGSSRETLTEQRKPVASEPSPSEAAELPLARTPATKATSIPSRRQPTKVPPASIAGPSNHIVTDPPGQPSPPTKRSAPWQFQVVDVSNRQHLLTLRGGPILRLQSWTTSGRVSAARDGPRTHVDQTPKSASAAAPMVPLSSAAPKISGGELEQHLMPGYPPRALQRNIQGVVVLKALVGKDGRVQSVELVSGPPLLASAALDAVRGWRYSPFYRSGEPAEFETQIAIQFTIKSR